MSIHHRVATNRKKRERSLAEVATVWLSLLAVSVIAALIFLFLYQKKPRSLDYAAPSTLATPSPLTN